MNRSRRTLARRLLSAAFLLLLATLLASLARHLDWRGAGAALAGYRAATLLPALAATAAGHLVYSCFDLLGRRWARHGLPWQQILPITFVCYAFNLNLGSWIGGLGMRYRLYRRLGLDNLQIAKVYSLSLATNWSGFLLLAGPLFAAGAVVPPANWAIGLAALRLLGLALLALSAVYLLLCAFARRRAWFFRGHGIGLPGLRQALLQMALGAANWVLMAQVIYLLLQRQVAFPTVLGVLLISAIAGVITHIPAGLGVLEAVFLALLQQQVDRGELLAALIGYRVLYFLLPLLVAAIVYLVIEMRAGRMRQHGRARPPNDRRTAP